MARLPLITQRRDIDVRVVYGQSIFELYQQIQNLLQREAPGLTNFFAEPIVNAVRGEIAWNTRAIGLPRLAAGLSPEEWQKLSQLLNQKCELVRHIIGTLEKAGLKNSAGTEALRAMLMTPNLKQSLFIVGDDLVLAQWGCYQFGTDARSADLVEQIERQSKFTPPPAQLPTLEPEAPTEPIRPPLPPPPEIAVIPLPKVVDEPTPLRNPVPPEPAPVVAPVQAWPEPRPFFWRWLLLLFLLFLLLTGILWKYRQGHSWGSEAVLRTEIAELWQKVDKKARECGLLPSTSGGSATAPQASVSNEEFRDRQNENSIKPGSKLNVSLAWSDRADLDLYVKQPDGQFVFFKPCESPNCGTLDVDANMCDPRTPCTNLTERPLENISWRSTMQKGQYLIFVGMFSPNRPVAEIRPVNFSVQVTKDGKPTTYQGVFRREDMNCTDSCSVTRRPIAEFTIE
jgi:hypothetical protein